MNRMLALLVAASILPAGGLAAQGPSTPSPWTGDSPWWSKPTRRSRRPENGVSVSEARVQERETAFSPTVTAAGSYSRVGPVPSLEFNDRRSTSSRQQLRRGPDAPAHAVGRAGDARPRSTGPVLSAKPPGERGPHEVAPRVPDRRRLLRHPLPRGEPPGPGRGDRRSLAAPRDHAGQACGRGRRPIWTPWPPRSGSPRPGASGWTSPTRWSSVASS